MLILPGVKAISISEKSSCAVSVTFLCQATSDGKCWSLQGRQNWELLKYYRQAGDKWGRPSQGGGLKELATDCSQALGCTWVPQCRESLLVVVPFPLLVALVARRLDEVGDPSPDGDVKEGLTVIAGDTNHSTALGHSGGKQTNKQTNSCLWLCPDWWACFLQVGSANMSKTSCHKERSQGLGFYSGLPLLT